MTIDVKIEPFKEGRDEGYQVVRPTHIYREGPAINSMTVVYRVRMREMDGLFIIEQAAGDRMSDTYLPIVIRTKRKSAVKEAQKAVRIAARQTLEMLTPIIRDSCLRNSQ